MSKAPQAADSSGSVVQKSLQIASRVKAEPDVSALARDTLDARKEFKQGIRARQDAEDAVFVTGGPLNAAERRTNRELMAFASRFAGLHASARQKGEKSAPFLFVFEGKAPHSLLRGGRGDRTATIDGLVARISDESQAGPEARRLARDLLRAIAAEKAALAHVEAAKEALEAARSHEEETKSRVVIAVRAMTNAVQAHYAHAPGQAREVLGYGDPAATRKAKAAAAAKAAKTATKKTTETAEE